MKIKIESVGNGYILTDFEYEGTEGSAIEERHLYLNEDKKILVLDLLEMIIGYNNSYGEAYYLIKGHGRKVGGLPRSLAEKLKKELEQDLEYCEDENKEKKIQQITAVEDIINDYKE